MKRDNFDFVLVAGCPCPCKGCLREIKQPGCHDHCPDYKAWRGEVDRVNANRQAYLNAPFAKIK